MKRDPRLQGLSAEHHHALVLARRTERSAACWDAAQGAALQERYQRELAPHFALEERLLGAALAQGSSVSCELAQRLLREHAALRELVAAAADGAGAAAAAFAELLRAHVRWEERELFPHCERELTAEQLDAVARACPH